MNRFFDIHDSTLSKVIEGEKTVTLVLDKAYVHQSLGQPGIDGGAGWLQKLELVLREAKIVEQPIHLPGDLADGFIRNGETVNDNGATLPINEEGNIELCFLTSQNEELRIEASSIVSREIGRAIYAEEFKA